MIDRNLARGLYLGAIALVFGITAWHYPQGSLSRGGAGLFPLMISGALLIIALLTVVRSRFVERQPLDISFRNIALVLSGLVVFAAVSRFVNMTLGILAMVFVVSFAASSYSWRRNLKVAAGLIAVAFAFQKLLGLNLPLF